MRNTKHLLYRINIMRYPNEPIQIPREDPGRVQTVRVQLPEVQEPGHQGLGGGTGQGRDPAVEGAAHPAEQEFHEGRFSGIHGGFGIAASDLSEGLQGGYGQGGFSADNAAQAPERCSNIHFEGTEEHDSVHRHRFWKEFLLRNSYNQHMPEDEGGGRYWH